MKRTCPECGQPVSRRRFRSALTAHEMLKLRDRLSAVGLDMKQFCDHGLELARSLHGASHAGWGRVRLMRRSRRWLRDGEAIVRKADEDRGRAPTRAEDGSRPAEEDPRSPRMKL